MSPKEEIKIEVPLPVFVEQIVEKTIDKYLTNKRRLETCPMRAKLEATKGKIIGLIIGVTIASSTGGAIASQVLKLFK